MNHIKLYESFLNEAEESKKLTAVKKQFNVKEEDGATILSVKGGKDFPWRIVKKDGKFVLAHSFSARTNIKPTFQKKKEGTFDECLDYIIKSHNKAAKDHMKGSWKEITI